MDIFEALRSVKKEAYELRGYKALPKPAKILFFISLIFVVAFCYVQYALIVLLSILLKLFSCPRDYLLKYVQEASERDKVKNGSQAVIYFFGFPLVMFLTIPYVLIYAWIFFGFFIFEVLVYVATLGGINFQPFLLEYDLKMPGKELLPQPEKPAIILAAISLVLFVVGLILFLVSFNVNAGQTLLTVSSIITIIHLVLVVVYSVCISRHQKK